MLFFVLVCDKIIDMPDINGMVASALLLFLRRSEHTFGPWLARY